MASEAATLNVVLNWGSDDEPSDGEEERQARRLQRSVCKAWPMCRSTHLYHACAKCGDIDSNHVARDCPHYPKIYHCDVPWCRINHSRHYCRGCNKFDVTHCDKFCPEFDCRTGEESKANNVGRI